MRSSELPEDGPARVGAVPLPAGRRVVPFEGSGQPVALVIGVDVLDPGQVWSALSDLRRETGLVAVLLEGGEGEEGYFFHRPAGSPEIDRLDPATVLAALWDGKHEDSSGPAAMFDAPLSMGFLGLDRPPPGGRSLADIAGAIFDVTTDAAVNEELTRLNEIDRRNAGWPPAGDDEPEPSAEPSRSPGWRPRQKAGSPRPTGTVPWHRWRLPGSGWSQQHGRRMYQPWLAGVPSVSNRMSSGRCGCPRTQYGSGRCCDPLRIGSGRRC